MGWTGICIEPLPSAFSSLRSKRTSICEQVCVADFEGEEDFSESDAGIDEKMLSGLTRNFDPRHIERLKRVASDTRIRKVPVTRLCTLLEKHSLYDIDYCSIDTEGSEYSILKDLDLDRFRISLFTIENNYDDEKIPALMKEKGYEFVAKLEQDYLFRRKEIRPLPDTSIFCAVWSQDPRRSDLLRRHYENVARQTVPVDLLYVFDSSDEPPDWLHARKVKLYEPLTIYQAWNVALSLVSTPFAMNLNLDDRLAPDAVERLQSAMLRTNASLVGGDWKVCYSQAETDAVTNCYAATELPFVNEWPPKPGTLTRLGSGTGNRGTFGPSAMWRLDAHLGAPRYPWRFPEGTPMRVVGDAAWWTVLQSHLKKKIMRHPEIIGNYHSHPDTQAEFRAPENEWSMLNELGISLL